MTLCHILKQYRHTEKYLQTCLLLVLLVQGGSNNIKAKPQMIFPQAVLHREGVWIYCPAPVASPKMVCSEALGKYL